MTTAHSTGEQTADVVASKPAPDSGAVRDAARRRYACERLAPLSSEFSVDAPAECVEARSRVRRNPELYT